MKDRGFTLIEIIIAVGLSALFLPALVFVYSFSLNSARQGESYTQAYALAQEQMEAVFYIKENDIDWDWENYPENNAEDNYYQPSNTSGNWQLGSKTYSPQEINGYTSAVKILPVNRFQGDISDQPWSVPDPTTRKIVVKVSWKENGEPVEIDLVSYVSQY